MDAFQKIDESFWNDEATEESEADNDRVGDAPDFRGKNFGSHNPDQSAVSGIAQKPVWNMKTYEILWLFPRRHWQSKKKNEDTLCAAKVCSCLNKIHSAGIRLLFKKNQKKKIETIWSYRLIKLDETFFS